MTRSTRGWDISLQSAKVLVGRGLARTTAICPGVYEGFMVVPTTELSEELGR